MRGTKECAWLAVVKQKACAYQHLTPKEVLGIAFRTVSLPKGTVWPGYEKPFQPMNFQCESITVTTWELRTSNESLPTGKDWVFISWTMIYINMKNMQLRCEQHITQQINAMKKT